MKQKIIYLDLNYWTGINYSNEMIYVYRLCTYTLQSLHQFRRLSLFMHMYAMHVIYTYVNVENLGQT